MKNKIKYLIILSLFISFINLKAQKIIPPMICSINAWAPDCCGTQAGSKINGNLHSNWSSVTASNAKFGRYCGIQVDKDAPSHTQYIKIIDSLRARGMEPMVGVSYNGGPLNSGYDSSDARKLVQYINITRGKKVKYWIIGNEPNAYPGTNTAKKFATYIKQYAIAMKKIDPTIKIIGPEFNYTPGDQNDTLWKIIDTLLMPGNANSICDLIPSGNGSASGKGYIDYFSTHQYDNGGGAHNRSYYINCMTATTTGFTRDTTGFGHLKRDCASATSGAGRSSQPIKAMITEANIDDQSGASVPFDDSFQRNKCSSFFAGQHWSEMLCWGMYQDIQSINFWSADGGDGMGYLTGGATGTKKSTYYHFQQIAKWFKDSLFIGVDDSLGTGSNSKSFKSFGAKTTSHIAIIVMNEDTSSKADKIYEVGLNNNSTTNTKTRLNYGMHLNKTYTDTMQAASTTLLIFNCDGDIGFKYRYQLKDSLTTNYQFRSVWAATSPAKIISTDIGPDATQALGCPHIFTSYSSPGHTVFLYQWYVNGIAQSGATNQTFSYNGSSGTYTITCIITVGNCTAKDDAILSIGSLPCQGPMKYASQNSTGSNSNENNIQSLVPNPTDGKVNIYYALVAGTTNAEILVSNYSGQLIAKYNLNKSIDKLELDASSLPAGMYFTTLVVDGKKVSTKKLIVTK